MNKAKGIFNFSVGLIFLFAFSAIANAESQNIQLRMKAPNGTYPTASGVSVRVHVLSIATSCILREELFSGQNLVDGSLSLALGNGALGPNDPGLSLSAVYDNSVSRSGLSCVDADGNVISTAQTYSPTSSDIRKIRLYATIGSDVVVANFDQRYVPFAHNSNRLEGKTSSQFLQPSSGTELNQANLETIFATPAKLSNLANVANSGTATNFSGTISGDLTGTQSATVVARIRGTQVSPTAPTTGQVLAYNGSEWAPTNGLPKFVVAGTDQSSTVTALANATGLVSGLTAGRTYRIKATIGYTAAATTTGIRIGFTYPTATIATGRVETPISNTDGTAQLFTGSITASGDSVLTTASPIAAPTVNLATVEALIRPTANGNFQIQFASEIAGSAVVIKQGSLLEVIELP